MGINLGYFAHNYTWTALSATLKNKYRLNYETQSPKNLHANPKLS